MKSPLKWVGGKASILPTVLATFPDIIEGDYHEPFVGGGTVLLNCIPRVKGTVYASDINKNLIDLYISLRDDPMDCINQLSVLTDTSEEAYYRLRSEFNRCPTPALFIYLNKVGFRGLYRESKNGFNVPYGHMKNPALFDRAHILAVSTCIQNVVFIHQSFEVSLSHVKSNDFVYMDPPYVPVDVKSFVNYTSSGFDESLHRLLFENSRNLACPWVMSNADVPFVREQVVGHQIDSLVVRRAINSKNPGAHAQEVLVHSM